ncbi:MAG TPA: YhcH/YjgK/YiaL family protein [Candidatus Baltobacteraceae bacterium]|nr:YhcH/YjgK/YiaL family protein [Candidatus Baltobacteraceae bacterium]
MIADSLTRCERHYHGHPRFAAAFQFLRELPPNPPDGRHEIDGERVFALVQSYATAPASERKLEHHRKHLDIQFLMAGEELIEHAPLEGLAVEKPYDEDKDYGLVKDPEARSSLVLRPGQFGIFFPEDAHKPGCTSGRASNVRKVVVKVRL